MLVFNLSSYAITLPNSLSVKSISDAMNVHKIVMNSRVQPIILETFVFIRKFSTVCAEKFLFCIPGIAIGALSGGASTAVIQLTVDR